MLREKSAVGLLLAVPTWGIASQDRIAPWEEITVRALVHEQPVTVVARVLDGRLISVNAESLGKRVEIPASELKDLHPHGFTTSRFSMAPSLL